MHVSRVAYIEPVGGIAGDMLLAALVELGADLEPIRAALGALGVPEVQLSTAQVQRGAFTATHLQVSVDTPSHHHRRWSDIRALIADSTLPERARTRALVTRGFSQVPRFASAIAPRIRFHFWNVQFWLL